MVTRMKPQSKAGQVRAAERILTGLLRTPKTRGGLVAAVTTALISRNFVFGWLSEKSRDGTLTKLKSGNVVMYQIAASVVVETPAESIYPAWLDPRFLPMAAGRSVYIDGVHVPSKGK